MSLEHKETLRGVRTTFSNETLEGLARMVTDARRKAGKRVDYNAVYNELKRTNKTVRSSRPRTGRGSQCPSVTLTPKEVLGGAKSILKNMLGQHEDQGEINRRAAICAKCPHLCYVKGCKSGCSLSRAALDAYNRGLKGILGVTRYTIPTAVEATYCGICGCSSMALIAAKPEDFPQDSPEKAAARPEACWIKR